MAVFGRLRMPSLGGATGWLNSEPLGPAELGGRVVLVNFWTLTCINWLRQEPYVRAWSQAYRDDGLIVIGVHTPEFSEAGAYMQPSETAIHEDALALVRTRLGEDMATDAWSEGAALAPEDAVAYAVPSWTSASKNSSADAVSSRSPSMQLETRAELVMFALANGVIGPDAG
jgi:thiol-disulfide isomerase/thioredoxin